VGAFSLIQGGGEIFTMMDDSGQLSIDFLIGFTIFMVAFIFVAIMTSSLLVHLQTRTIDYDAVAYRTSVVLVEDPGQPRNWQTFDLSIPADRDNVKRLGLAVDKGYPGILKMNKIEKFFNQTSSSGCSDDNKFCFPGDYQEKLLFGDFPYAFNISIKGLNSSSISKTMGKEIPLNSNYGYIKRIVKIEKSGSIAVINATDGDKSVINVLFNFTELYQRSPAYRIDPLNEEMRLTIQNFTGFTEKPNLTGVQVCNYPLIGVEGCLAPYENSPTIKIFTNGNPHTTYPVPIENNDNLTLIFEQGYFQRIGLDEYSTIQAVLTFDRNVTDQSLFTYNYSNAQKPELEPAVLEVRVW
jgi:hypothetical protein